MNVLPEEIVISVINEMDSDTLNNIYHASKYMNNLCETKAIRNNMILRFHRNTLDLTDFTFHELIFYFKVYKPKMNLLDAKNNIFLTICMDDDIFILTGGDIINLPKADINQIITIKTNIDYVSVVLTNDGKVYNGLDKYAIKESLPVPEKIISISAGVNDDFFMITKKRGYYYWRQNVLSEFKGLYNVTQIVNNLFLTSDGKVYKKNHFDDDIKPDIIESCGVMEKGSSNFKGFNNFYQINGLPKIRQIASNNFALSEDGQVYKIDVIDLIAVRTIKHLLNHVVQIYSCDKCFIVVDNDGNVFDMFGSIIKKLSNITETTMGNKDIYALDDKSRLHIYFKCMTQIYDLLNM